MAATTTKPRLVRGGAHKVGTKPVEKLRQPKKTPVAGPPPPVDGMLKYNGNADVVPEVYLACSTDGSRSILMHPWLERVGPRSKARLFLCATNSYQIVRVPMLLLDEEGQTIHPPDELLGLVHVGAIKAWRKLMTTKGKAAPQLGTVKLRITTAGARLEFPGGAQEWEKPAGAPLSYARVIKPYFDGATPEMEDFAIGVNPTVFAQAAAAIGVNRDSRPVVIRFSKRPPKLDTEGKIETTYPDEPTTLRPMIISLSARPVEKLTDLDEVGIVMPVRVMA